MTALLTIDDLSVTIANKPLLTDISLTVNHGDYLCVLGANGAGKSTLLKTLMAIVPATTGKIWLNRFPLSQLNQKLLAQQVSYVPQAYGHQLDFMVYDFIRMGRYAFHSAFSNWTSIDQYAMDRAISITETEIFLDRHIQTLSGGEKQRVMIAAALCQQTPLLLLDEPTSSLDPHHQVEMHHLIAQLNKTHNITIIEVSHDLNHACQHSQHILALKHGKMLWYGKAIELLQNDYLDQLYDQHFVFTSHPQTGAMVALPGESE